MFFYKGEINHEGTFKKIFSIRYRLVFSSRGSRVDCPFGSRHHAYIQCKLRVEPEQLSILGNLHVHHQYAINHRTILADPEQ